MSSQDIRNTYSELSKYGSREFLVWIAVWLSATGALLAPIDTSVEANLQAWQWVFKSVAMLSLTIASGVFTWQRFKLRIEETKRTTP